MELNQDSNVIEIIYICLDFDEVKFKKHIENLPWAYYPYQDPKIKELSSKYEITGIPRVLVFNKNGNLLTVNGRKEIYLKGRQAVFNWLTGNKSIKENPSLSNELSQPEEIEISQ